MAKRVKPTGVVAGGALLGVGATLVLGLGPSDAGSSGPIELAKAADSSTIGGQTKPQATSKRASTTSSRSANVTSKPKSSPTPAATKSATQAAADGSYTGDASAAGRYGLMQVSVQVTGGKLTDIQILQYPSNDRQSIQINQYALPILIQEALSVQSASVSNISGASYTSRAFATSLQSALAQAGL